MGHAYGWKPAVRDRRDFPFKLGAALPSPSVDLRATGMLEPIEDQRQIGSCVANAASGVIYFLRKKQGLKASIDPSRLFLYNFGRLYEGSFKEDAGLCIPDVYTVLQRVGVCDESLFPYDERLLFVNPSDNNYNPVNGLILPTGPSGSKAFFSAQHHRTHTYYRVSDGTDFAAIDLALSAGYPVQFGFTVYRSFEATGNDGLVPSLSVGEMVMGGHSMYLVGYNSIAGAKRYIAANSWGEGFGDRGFIYMTEDYLRQCSVSDCFTATEEAA